MKICAIQPFSEAIHAPPAPFIVFLLQGDFLFYTLKSQI
jgi:hypothetical protein